MNRSPDPRAAAAPRARTPVVVHVHHVFFERTETFIHALVSRHRRYRPELLAHELRNFDRFPFPAECAHLLAARRYSPRWWLDGLLRRATGRLPHGERVARAAGAGVIHAHFGPSGVLALPLARALRVPLVTSFYGNDMSQLARDAAWRDRYRGLFAAGDLFLCEGPFMRDRVIELGCRPERILVHPIGIALDRLRPPAKGGRRASGRPGLYFCARFTEKKGLLPLLTAAAAVAGRGRDFELLVAGAGPQEAEARALAGTPALAGRVRFLGFLTHDEHLDHLRRCDIFVQPSRTAADGDAEGGAPTTLLEAQALGVPVLATTHADIPNVVAPGESAVLCPEYDVDALAAAMAALIDAPEAWARMGEAGRRLVSERHDIAALTVRLEDHYDRVCGERRPAPGWEVE